MVNALHPAEIALLIESLPPAQRELVWDMVDPELEGEVLVELNENIRAGLIEGMEADELLAAAEGHGARRPRRPRRRPARNRDPAAR